MYDTKDRKKGSKDNKRNETRKRSDFYYGNGNFCSLRCQDDWFNTHGDNAINHFGRVEKPIILTEENAWSRRYNHHKWHGDNTDHLPDYIEVNMITKEERECQ